MKRIVLATTPTIAFRFNVVNPTSFVAAEMTIKGKDGILLTKTLSTAIVTSTHISWKLTQQETINLGVATYYVMCNWLLADGTRGATEEEGLQVVPNHKDTILGPSDTSGGIDDEPANHDAYIDPKDYGATGDGVTDDTAAIQEAVNSGSPVYFTHGRYVLTSPIVITNKVNWRLHAQDATFIYSGEDYAFRILSAENCQLDFGKISALNGGCIEFYSDSVESWNQYVKLFFDDLECKTDCIHVEVSGDGWCTENQVFGGRFRAGKNGVHILHNGENYTTGWKFYNCGIEGAENGFLFNAGTGYIHSMAIILPRYEESYSTILKTVGFIFDCLWLGTSVVKPAELECSSETSRFEILAPIRTIWDGALIRHRGCIIDGKLMAERTEYTEVS